MTKKTMSVVKKVVLLVCFTGLIIIITRVALQFGELVNPTTVGFSLLILVVLSAIFAGLIVAIATSVIATMFFNYFFFPPIGTFRIYDSHNWVAVFALFFTAIVISRLTASAHENAQKKQVLNASLNQLKEFTGWLMSTPREMITLSGIAEQVVRFFSLQYCSIHVYAEGKWHHFSGASIGDLTGQISDLLKENKDHPTKLGELAEEQGLGVQYSEIRTATESFAVVAVRGDLLTPVFDTIASMIGLFLTDILRESSPAVKNVR